VTTRRTVRHPDEVLEAIRERLAEPPAAQDELLEAGRLYRAIGDPFPHDYGIAVQMASDLSTARADLAALVKALQDVLARCAEMDRGVGYRNPEDHDTYGQYAEGKSDFAGEIEALIEIALGRRTKESRPRHTN
jgi:hypothetical protein